MHDKHTPHRPAGIVEHPFALVSPVLVEPDIRVLLYEDVQQGIDNDGSVFALTGELLRGGERPVDRGG